MNKSNYALEVLINGRPAKEYYRDGKAFIEGRENTQYTLKLRNNSWKRILAVFSVDGIEVIEGKVAAEFKGGYVLDPYSSIEVKGYRIDDKSVAAFRFAKTHKSYSNTVGAATVETDNRGEEQTIYQKTTRNNGIIGVRVFEEKTLERDYGSYASSSHGSSTTRVFYPTYGMSAGPSPATGYTYISGGHSLVGSILSCSGYSAPLASNLICATGCSAALTNIFSTNRADAYADQQGVNQTRGRILVADYSNRTTVNQMGLLAAVPHTITIAPDFNLGTTWGEKVDDKVKEVKFEKDDMYVDIDIYYDSRESLISYGIDFEATKQVAVWPAAFAEKKQYCKAPVNWEGRS